MPQLAADRRRLLAATAAVVAAVALLVWGLTPRGSTESRGGPAPVAGAPTTSTPTYPPSASPSATPTLTPTPTRSPSATPKRPPATSTPRRSAGPTFGPSTVKPRGEPKRVVVVSTSGETLVDADLVPSRLDDEGVLAPPFGVAGWYAEQGWAKPGWPGASILAGHINRRSPKLELDTFGHLTRVRSGDRITVVYTSGQSVTFKATRSKALSKKAVPQDDSIWDAGNPEPLLRLITCDPTTPVQGGHYKGNWVVWASLA
ncbi:MULTISPECIES: class F sortase [unclassified Knoellia]|uniref:class F sortase n=1 Tax=Knoellia altitudinis TaxID=3404795 RepID=UPI003608290C